MFNVGIIHGDINIQNILLNRRAGGRDSSPSALLVNFDRAIQFRTGRGVRQNQSAEQGVDPPSYIFQSTYLLTPHGYPQPLHPLYAPKTPRQDYLDDLESILWLLFYFSFFNRRIGTPQYTTGSRAPEWHHPERGCDLKALFLHQFAQHKDDTECPDGFSLLTGQPSSVWGEKEYLKKGLFWLIIGIGAVLEPLVVEKKLYPPWYEAVHDEEDRRKELEGEAGRVFEVFENAFAQAIKQVREGEKREKGVESGSDFPSLPYAHM